MSKKYNLYFRDTFETLTPLELLSYGWLFHQKRKGIITYRSFIFGKQFMLTDSKYFITLSDYSGYIHFIKSKDDFATLMEGGVENFKNIFTEDQTNYYE